jgi:hypothetical protein
VVTQCCGIDFNADPGPAFYLNADPDPESLTNADPGKTLRHLEKFLHANICTLIGNETYLRRYKSPF